MKITYLGHSCFLISDEKSTVIFDPYKPGSVPGYSPLNVSASQICCSHEHGDHYGYEFVNKTASEEDFLIKTIDTYHDEAKGTKRGPNKITIVEKNGFRAAHMGDIGCPLTDEQINQLKDLDILMIPVGGFYTIDAREAYEMAKAVNPKVIIPMHYKGDGFGYNEIGSVDSFAELFKSEKEIKFESGVVETDKLAQGIIVIMKGLNRA